MCERSENLEVATLEEEVIQIKKLWLVGRLDLDIQKSTIG